jgi:hypothetical protein
MYWSDSLLNQYNNRMSSVPTVSDLLTGLNAGFSLTLPVPADATLVTQTYETSFFALKKISCLPNNGEGWSVSPNYVAYAEWVNRLFTTAKSNTHIVPSQNLYFCKAGTTGALPARNLQLTKEVETACSSNNCFMTTDPDGCTKVMSSSNPAIPEPWNRIQLNPPNLSKTDTNPAAIYSYNNAFLRKLINDEFYYYKYCYQHALTLYLRRFLSSTTDSLTVLKEGCVKLNKKLNQILGIMQEVERQRAITVSSYYRPATSSSSNPSSTPSINSLNNDISTTKLQLSKDVELLKKAQDDSYIKNAMMEYTIEKNNSSRNLLAIYGFLNIVAIGIIYNLYTNAKK